MPRYIAADYVFKAEQHYRSILSDLLLSVPEHLEHVESYVHQGRVFDNGHRRPWTKVRNKKFEVNIAELINLTCINQSDIEKFESEEEIEVVPSSNPCSQLDVNAAKEQVRPNPCHEHFHEIDTKDFFHFENGVDTKLEEPISPEYLSNYKKQIPSVEALSGRLKPKHVPDPFTSKEGTPISDNNLFRGERIFAESSPNDRADQITKEEFRVKKLRLEEITLEEKLQYPLDKHSHERPLTPCSSSELKSVLHLCPEKVSGEEMDVTDMVKLLVSDLVNSLPQDNVNKSSAPEGTGDPRLPPIDTAQVFEQLNSHDTSVGDMDRSAMLLESPVSIPDTENNPIDLTMSLQDTLNLQKLDIEDNKKLILTDGRDRSLLEGHVWYNEKYFTDISILRLPEISVNHEQRKENAVDQVKQILNISVFEGIRLLELELPWDPLVDTLESSIDKSKKMLRFDNTDKRERRYAIEVFEKVDLSSSRGAPDRQLSTVGLAGFERTRNRIQNKLKDIPKYSAAKQLRRLKRSDVIREANQAMYSERAAENTTASSETTPSSKRKSLTVTPSVDPIETFIWMRNNIKGASTPAMLHGSAKRYKPVRELSQETPQPRKVEVLPNQPVPKSDLPKANIDNTERKGTAEPKVSGEAKKTTNGCKPESTTLKAPFTGEYLGLFEALNDAAKPFAEKAIETRILHPTQSFPTLTPEVTRFMIRQYEHHQQPSSDVDETYRALLSLHTLVTAAYLLLHCSLASAILALEVMSDKHPSLKGESSLSRSYELLCEQQRILRTQGKLHPKLSLLEQYVTSVLSNSSNGKVLVACNKELQNILEDVHNVLLTVEGGKPLITTENDSIEEFMTKADVNLVVTFARLVKDNSTNIWDHFTCVVEYDPLSGSVPCKLKSSCETNGIRYIALQSVIKPEYQSYTAHGNSKAQLKKDHRECPADGSRQEEIEQLNEEQHSSPDQYIFMGSTTVTANSELLHSLESRHNIQLLERDYDAFRAKENRSHFADIDIDVQTGVVLCSLLDLQGTKTAEPLIVKLALLSAKYSHCWLIVFNPSKGKRYALGGSAVINVAKLHSSMSHLLSETFSIRIIMCDNEEKAASAVKQIAVNSRTHAERSGICDWFDRNFLKYNISKQEEFLLAFPCLNSFSAQMLLAKATLPEILASSQEKLTSMNPKVPSGIIQAFCEMKKDGGNVPNDHGDGLDRESVEIHRRSVSRGNREEHSVSRSPDHQDFKLQIYSGARSDTTHSSEIELSSVSYEEHEVPDIETPERLELANEFEIAEMEGARRPLDSYPNKASEMFRAQMENRGAKSKNWNENSENFSHSRLEHFSEMDILENRDHLHTNNFHQMEFPFVPEISMDSRDGTSSRFQENKKSGRNLKARNFPDEPGASFGVNFSRVPEMGGHVFNSRDFSEEGHAMKPDFSKINTDNGTSNHELWAQFNDGRNLDGRIRREKQEAESLRNRGFSESGLTSRGGVHSTAHYREDMREAETPRIHQPYTQPHHRTSKSLWKMPPRLPSIAAVTPSPRNPVRVQEFMKIGTQHAQRRNIPVQDSPPMDPDSEDDEAPVRWSCQPMFNRERFEIQRVPDRRRSTQHNIPGPLRAGAAEYRHRIFDDSDTESTKKRRLTYKRVPGSRGGQTRLNFT